MMGHAISADGLSLMVASVAVNGMRWASGPLLPTVGRSTWTVRLEESAGNDGNFSIGVCDAARRNAWALHLFTGQLYRYKRDQNGRDTLPISEETGIWKRAPPSDGFPDGDMKQVIVDADGKPYGLLGRAKGATIEVCLDHDAGALSFGINGGPLQHALKGFPAGAPLRPFSRLLYPYERLRFGRPFIQRKTIVT